MNNKKTTVTTERQEQRRLCSEEIDCALKKTPNHEPGPSPLKFAPDDSSHRRESRPCWLENEAKRLYNFVKGGNNELTKIRKETLFIQILEGLHHKEADVLIDVKNGTLNKTYKGLTADMVKEAFGWNAEF